jgi:ribosome maturation factor RimP
MGGRTFGHVLEVAGAIGQNYGTDGALMGWQESVAQTVTGLGFELVDIERSTGGLLRITIDVPWTPPAEGAAPVPERFVTVDDCELVTRQLQYLLEVEGVDYRRLEVGSPGIDRPLRNETDFMRFVGRVVDITLKAPIGPTGTGVAANRKKFRGTLEHGDDDQHWRIVWRDEPVPSKPGARVGRKREAAPLQALTFRLDEVQQARLAPLVDFRTGRPSASGRKA